MNLRLTYNPWGETLEELVDAAREAEAAGAEIVWAPELHRSATVTCAALAGATSTATVATGVALAFTRSPMITALEALDLDDMTGGRFILGLGSGVKRLNADWHGVTVNSPAGQLRDTVGAIRAFWAGCESGEPILYEGSHQSMRINGYVRPSPTLRTNIPIYLGAMGPVLTALAGEIADGFVSHELCSPSWFSEHILPDLARGLGRGGRDRAGLDVVVSACCSIDADSERARRRAAGLVAFYASVRSYADFFAFHDATDDHLRAVELLRSGRGADHLAEAVGNDAVDALTLSGTRDEVAARISAYDGVADAVKLSPPTHGVAPAETRAAQREILALIADLNRGS